ncbi:MAG: alpha-tubulin suppressor-like RCC1 family protein [Bacillariaceae sp.]|jgi:alpha-tubulin suppressor-like RCC1 family protein
MFRLGLSSTTSSLSRRSMLRYRVAKQSAAAISTTTTTTTTTATTSSLQQHGATKRSFSSTTIGYSLSLYTWGTDKSGCLLQQDDDNTNNNNDNNDNDQQPKKANNSICWEPQLAVAANNLDSRIIDVCCGLSEIVLVTENGKVHVAGENKKGNLGLGHKNQVPKLTELKVGNEIDENDDSDVLFEKCVLGPNTGALIGKNGDLYSFGSGGSLISGAGCLGQGNTESYLRPTLVQSLVEDGCMVQDVALGESHSTVLTTDGEVLTTGAANYGRLGNGETSEDTLYFDSVEILPSETVTQIAGGESFTLALTKEGVIYGWGRNHKGQLGTGFGMAVDMYAMEQIPTPMDGDELINRTVTKIAAGTNHGACVTSNGELFWWGSSLHLEPVRVTEVLHTKIVDVECGLDYTMALSEDHELFVWGAGKTGVLGQGPDTKTLHQAQMINSLLKKDNAIVSMSAGSNFASCMVLEM